MNILKGIAAGAFVSQFVLAHIAKASAASKGQSTQAADLMIESAKKGLENVFKP
ncbi:hypothetical protein [Pseudanabaena minima]|uniref:hypothetical protein n=1 Tax=Pseudanabaena minima TaxID=890415 RepID=UPI003DA860AB